MAKVRIHIGTAPNDEPCAQTGITRDWLRLQQIECLVYRAALIARFGPPPAGKAISCAHNTHHFGSYIDLVVLFDDEDDVPSGGAAWAETVADGLARWGDGGFITRRCSQPGMPGATSRSRWSAIRFATACTTIPIAIGTALATIG
jgi:hypothetical protein